jgi:nicotinic acid mononucleotide adenylyltransferase
VANRFALDGVVFVPTGQPGQRAHRKVSTTEDRYVMTVITTASNPYLVPDGVVSDSARRGCYLG